LLASGADMPHDTELGQNIRTAARRTRGWFVRWMVVDAERLVIWYHEPALVENARLQCVPPRGFVFCASIAC